MKKKLEEMKKKLKAKDKDKDKGADAEDKKASKSKTIQKNEDTPEKDDVDAERESILSRGKRYVRPLSLSPQKALKVTGGIISGLLVGAVALFAVLIYVYESDNDLVYGASKIIPYPAECIDGSFGCVIGGSAVRYSDYQFNLRTLKTSSSNQLGEDDEVDFTTEEGQQQLDNFKTLALLESRQNVILRNIAKDKGVSVESEEVDEEVDNFIESEGGQDQLETAIESIYGWSLSEFRSVVKMQLLRTKIQEEDAQEVLDLVEGGEDFAELAREYSSDTSAEEGGDLGFIDEETSFVEEFKEAALALEVGETTGLVQTQFGFHIITATDSDPDEGLRDARDETSPASSPRRAAASSHAGRTSSTPGAFPRRSRR